MTALALTIGRSSPGAAPRVGTRRAVARQGGAVRAVDRLGDLVHPLLSNPRRQQSDHPPGAGDDLMRGLHAVRYLDGYPLQEPSRDTPVASATRAIALGMGRKIVSSDLLAETHTSIVPEARPTTSSGGSATGDRGGSACSARGRAGVRAGPWRTSCAARSRSRRPSWP